MISVVVKKTIIYTQVVFLHGESIALLQLRNYFSSIYFRNYYGFLHISRNSATQNNPCKYSYTSFVNS